MNSWLILGIGWGVMSLVMAGLWGIQRVRGDAGIVDVAWALGVGLLGSSFAVLATGGNEARRIAVGTLALLWSARLGGHILQRVLRMPEDGRYQNLRQEWGSRVQSRLFWFFQIQAFWSVLFAAPILLAALNPTPFPRVIDLTGIVIGLVAILGEGIADWQLSAFRHDSANRGKVCRSGLWRYSRHPNYFFEWLHWWSYACLAWSGPWGWVAFAGPACMLLFLFKVTGIPPTEAQALKSRGEAYREYQRTTSIFFPWPPRS